MLPENVSGTYISEIDFNKFNYQLEIALRIGYSYSQDEVVKIVAEMLKASYTKGRKDQAYYGTGPLIDAYTDDRSE